MKRKSSNLENNDPTATITELLSDLQSSQFLRPVGVSSKAWEIIIKSKVPEPHDRIIYSTAIAHAADAIITNDLEIIASTYRTVW